LGTNLRKRQAHFQAQADREDPQDWNESHLFIPILSIFDKTTYSFDTLAHDCDCASWPYLNKGLKITLADERTEKSTEFRFTGGIGRIVKHLNAAENHAARFADLYGREARNCPKSKLRCSTTTRTAKTFLPSLTPSTRLMAARTSPAFAPP